MTVKLGNVIQVELRRACPKEGGRLTPWLVSPDGPELLQDVLGKHRVLTETYLRDVTSWA